MNCCTGSSPSAPRSHARHAASCGSSPSGARNSKATCGWRAALHHLELLRVPWHKYSRTGCMGVL